MKDIDFEQELYNHFGQVKDFTLGMRIGKHFYDLGCRRTAEKYDEIEYNRQRAEEWASRDLKKEIETQLSIFPYTKVSPELPESRFIVIQKELFLFARHFAKWGAECLARAGKTSSGSSEIPNDMEEAKEAYCDEHNDDCFDATGDRCPHIARAFIAGAKWQKQHSFTHHETNESLEEAVTHQMEDDGDVDDFIRKGLDKTVLKYAQIGAEWQAEQLLSDRPLPEDTALFNKGVEEGRRLAEEEQAELFTIVALDAAQRAKEQMMKDGNVILTEEDFDAEKEKSMEWGYNLCKEQMMEDAVEGEVVQDLKGVNRIKSFGKIPEGLHFGDKVRIIIVKED